MEEYDIFLPVGRLEGGDSLALQLRHPLGERPINLTRGKSCDRYKEGRHDYRHDS